MQKVKVVNLAFIAILISCSSYAQVISGSYKMLANTTGENYDIFTFEENNMFVRTQGGSLGNDFKSYGTYELTHKNQLALRYDSTGSLFGFYKDYRKKSLKTGLMNIDILVLDLISEKPISNANIIIHNEARGYLADENGRVNFQEVINRKLLVLEITSLGYQSLPLVIPNNTDHKIIVFLNKSKNSGLPFNVKVDTLNLSKDRTFISSRTTDLKTQQTWLKSDN